MKQNRRKIKAKVKNNTPITIILFIAMIVSLFGNMMSMARYRETVESTIDVNLAKWTFNLKDNETQSFLINLARYKNSGRAITPNMNTITPGDNGAFLIELDFTGSQVATNYTITLTQIEENAFPENIKFNVQNADGTITDLETIPITGKMSLEEIKEYPIKTIVIRWFWEIDKNINESEYEGKDFSIKLEVKGTQEI